MGSHNKKIPQQIKQMHFFCSLKSCKIPALDTARHKRKTNSTFAFGTALTKQQQQMEGSQNTEAHTAEGAEQILCRMKRNYQGMVFVLFVSTPMNG